MNRAALLITAGAGLLLLASSAQGRSNVEAGQGGPSFDFSNLTDSAENLMNQITETPSDVDLDTAGVNITAFLSVLSQAEGTAAIADPYRVCFGYKHTIRDYREHPAITGEWFGEKLDDQMCRNAGFGPGCVSTAAGAYQIKKNTWKIARDALGLSDFSPASQDAAAVELIRRRGALEDVKAGRFATAINKCRNEWASLPGNYARQGQRSIQTLTAWFEQNGGTTA